MGLFQTFLARIWEIYYWKFERLPKKPLTRSVFELEKCSFFFKWVRISPEIDWYHYQGANPAPTCKVRHQIMTNTPTRWSVTSEPSVQGNKTNPVGDISSELWIIEWNMFCQKDFNLKLCKLIRIISCCML